MAGVNPALDALSTDQIREVIGAEVEVVGADGGKARCRVVDVQTSSSIIDKKNIFILLPGDAEREQVAVGGVVYSFGEE